MVGFFLPIETRTNIDFEADIKNNGTFNESNVEIELIITNTTYSRSQVFSNSQYISLDSGIEDEIRFGYYPDANVNAPYDGQSLARVAFGYYGCDWQGFPEWVTFYELVKENMPSLGSNIYSVNTRGTFCGYVFDLQESPVSNAKIYYFSCPDDEAFLIEPSEEGYFENTYMCGMNYDVTIYVNDIAMLDTTITIEPDSTTYCEFFLNFISADEKPEQWKQINLMQLSKSIY